MASCDDDKAAVCGRTENELVDSVIAAANVLPENGRTRTKNRGSGTSLHRKHEDHDIAEEDNTGNKSKPHRHKHSKHASVLGPSGTRKKKGKAYPPHLTAVDPL